MNEEIKSDDDNKKDSLQDIQNDPRLFNTENNNKEKIS